MPKSQSMNIDQNEFNYRIAEYFALPYGQNRIWKWMNWFWGTWEKPIVEYCASRVDLFGIWLGLTLLAIFLVVSVTVLLILWVRVRRRVNEAIAAGTGAFSSIAPGSSMTSSIGKRRGTVRSSMQSGSAKGSKHNSHSPSSPAHSAPLSAAFGVDHGSESSPPSHHSGHGTPSAENIRKKLGLGGTASASDKSDSKKGSHRSR